MAVCRFTALSDVYLLPATQDNGEECWKCMACRLLDNSTEGERADSVLLHSVEAAIGHLTEHQSKGDKVPSEAVEYFEHRVRLGKVVAASKARSRLKKTEQ